MIYYIVERESYKWKYGSTTYIYKLLNYKIGDILHNGMIMEMSESDINGYNMKKFEYVISENDYDVINTHVEGFGKRITLAEWREMKLDKIL